MARYRCFVCGHGGDARTQHDAHLVPYSRGGVKVRDACRKCNLQMGAKTRGEYGRWLNERPGEWFPWPDGDRRPFIRQYLRSR